MSTVLGMKGGLGSPIVRLYDLNGNGINYINYSKTPGIVAGEHSFNSFNIGKDVTSFSYEYNDDGDDECLISIETSDQLLPDHPNLAEDSQLKVQWGYIGHLSPARLVAIRNSKVRYLADRIVIDLKCTDLVSYKKTLKTKDTEDELSNEGKKTQLLTFFEWLNRRLGKDKGGLGYKVVYNGTTLLKDNKAQPIDIQIVKKVGEELEPLTSIFNVSKPSKATRSEYQAIKESLEKMDNGPWFIDGRDGTLTIHNRTNSFVDKPKRTYTYRGGSGDLISFIPEVKDKVQSISVARTTTVDPDTKEITTIDNAYVKPDSSRVYAQTDLSFGGEEDNNIYHQEGEEGVIKERGRKYLLKLYEKWKELGELTTLELEEVDKLMVVLNTESNATERYSSLHDGEVVSTPTTEIDNTATRIESQAYIPRSIDFNGPYAKEVMQQMLTNEIREKEQESRVATLRIIGDPDLENRIIIEVTGVAKKHSGKYYIMKCTHTVDSGGYYTELDTYQESKEVINVLTVIENTVADTKTENVDESTGEPLIAMPTLLKGNKSTTSLISLFSNNDKNKDAINQGKQDDQSTQAVDNAIINILKDRAKVKYDTYRAQVVETLKTRNGNALYVFKKPEAKLNKEDEKKLAEMDKLYNDANTYGDLEKVKKYGETNFEGKNIKPLDLNIVTPEGDILPAASNIKKTPNLPGIAPNNFIPNNTQY